MDIAGFGGATLSVLALCSNGDLWAWGYNGQGQLGYGTTTHLLNPAIVQTYVLKLFSDGMTSHNYGYVIQNFILKSVCLGIKQEMKANIGMTIIKP